ncbi:2-phosphosulfolactate phosphatase [Streptoalloteichus hindustanus]|uniref:Probable 2-phosphosulfolactate phosphatase n=1 Tax=Streptoalloteichus hindustanus TaxID=2017 RepID=A0A1M5NMA4_STRHI|nr:2-phosphosulfolactate phosphatase [Streptoalloteichus hindustanus]
MVDQDGYAVRLEWGLDGVHVLGRSCGALVVVDVLSFSTTTDLLVAAGCSVLRARKQAGRAGAVFVAGDMSPPRPSLLPELPTGTLVALPSPNGATLATTASGSGAVALAGCLRNARAVAGAALRVAGGRPVGVVPAGERWGPTHEGGLRPAIEDLLGAGAVVAALAGLGAAPASPEAVLAADAFHAARPRLSKVLRDCVSGRELADAGLPADVSLAAEVDASDTAPVLVAGRFVDAWARWGNTDG